MMETIDSIVTLLGSDRTTVEDVIGALGPVIEKQAGSGYQVKPRDERLVTAWMGIDADSDTEEVLRYVELTFLPSVGVCLDDLREGFGHWTKVPARPEGKPFVVKFRHDDPNKQYLIILYATLSGEANVPTTTIKELVIQREERL